MGCQILLSQDMVTCFILQKFDDGLKVHVLIYVGLFEKILIHNFSSQKCGYLIMQSGDLLINTSGSYTLKRHF